MSETTDPKGRSSAEIEGDVGRTRARMTDTLGALRDRMSPNQIIDQVVDYARGSGGAEFMNNLGSSVRGNPLPVLLIGAGIGWLLLSDKNKGASSNTTATPTGPVPALPAPSRSTGQDTTASGSVGERSPHVSTDLHDRAHSAASAASGLVSKASGAAQNVLGQVEEFGSSLADRATNAAQKTAETFSNVVSHAAGAGAEATAQVSVAAGQVRDAARERTDVLSKQASRSWTMLAEDQPLLLGALGLAVGAALGALLPRTETENRLMGDASDTVKGQVGAVAQDGYQQARESVGEHLGQAQDTLSGMYSEAKGKLDERGVSAGAVANAVGAGVSQAAAVVTNTVKDVAEDAKQQLQEAAPGAEPAGHPPPSSTPHGSTSADQNQETGVVDTFPASDPATDNTTGSRAVDPSMIMAAAPSTILHGNEAHIGVRFATPEDAKLAVEALVRDGPVDRRRVEMQPGSDGCVVRVEAKPEDANRVTELLRKSGGRDL